MKHSSRLLLSFPRSINKEEKIEKPFPNVCNQFQFFFSVTNALFFAVLNFYEKRQIRFVSDLNKTHLYTTVAIVSFYDNSLNSEWSKSLCVGIAKEGTNEKQQLLHNECQYDILCVKIFIYNPSWPFIAHVCTTINPLIIIISNFKLLCSESFFCDIARIFVITIYTTTQKCTYVAPVCVCVCAKNNAKLKCKKS